MLSENVRTPTTLQINDWTSNPAFKSSAAWKVDDLNLNSAVLHDQIQENAPTELV